MEQQPHDQVHDLIGHGTGIMGDPGTAGYDPIFWLHHANIDRLWEAWLSTNPPHQNPPDLAWLNSAGADFHFDDGTGNTVRLTPRDVLDTRSAPFYYQYDDLTFPSLPRRRVPSPEAPSGVQPMAEHLIPEMAGASSEAMALSGLAQTLRLRLYPLSGPVGRLLQAEGHYHEAYLRVENVRGRGFPASYALYLNVPENRNTGDFEHLLVGSIPMFGLEQASIASGRHPGNGLNFTFDITETVQMLQAENMWNPEQLRVTFVPERETGEGARLEIGRVSLYFT
jgi:tyrosinase